MAKSYRPVNRDQPFLLPPDMREWLPPGHLVWFLLETLKQVDLRPFHVRHRNDGVGRAAYDPDMMVALLIYAYCCGERSSRRIERLCEVNVAFRVVCAGDVPDHTKIARFRAVHQEAFEAVFAQVLAIAAQAGLAKFETVAIDGSKIAANASIDANREESWLREQVAVMTAQAQAVDAGEDSLFGDRRGDELPPGLGDPGQRAARIAQALEQIEAQKAAAAQEKEADERAGNQRVQELRAGQRVRGRDPRATPKVEAAQARLERAIADQQAKVDAYAEAVAAAVTARDLKPDGARPVAAADHWRVRQARQRLAEAEQADRDRQHAEQQSDKTNPGKPGKGERGPRANVTDPQSRIMPTRKGWVQGYNAQFAVTADQIIVALDLGQDPGDVQEFIPMMHATQAAAETLFDLTGHRRHRIGVLLADAGYPSQSNLTAPGPDRLIALGKSRAQAKAAKTRPTQGNPPPNATARAAMDHRLRTPEGSSLYKRRGATVEPGIGNLKKLLDRFSRRGLAAARSELHLAAAAFNLRKIHTAALT